METDKKPNTDLYFTQNLIGQAVEFYPMARHIEEYGFIKKVLSGNIKSVTFTKAKVMWNIETEHNGEKVLLQKIDSCNICKVENIGEDEKLPMLKEEHLAIYSSVKFNITEADAKKYSICSENFYGIVTDVTLYGENRVSYSAVGDYHGFLFTNVTEIGSW